MASRLSIAIDPKMKERADKLYKHMGMSLSSAVRIFIQQSINDHAMPFQPHEISNPVPTKGTLEAMRELEHPENLRSYTSAKQMMKDILNDNK